MATSTLFRKTLATYPRPAGAQSTATRSAFLLFAVLGISGILAWWVIHASMNADEGFYGAAAREIWQGHMPYRDFGFTQLPVFPVVVGAILELLGHGLIELRSVCASFTLIAIGIAIRAVRRHNPNGVTSLLVLLLASSGWLAFSAITKTYTLAGLFLIATAATFLSQRRWGERLFWMSVFGSLAIGTRLPVAPFVAILWLALLCEKRAWTNVALAALAPAGGLTAILLPFALADWTSFKFWTWEFHTASGMSRDAAYRYLGLAALALPVWLGLLAAVIRVLMNRDATTRNTKWLLLACVAGVLSNIVPTGGYGEYCLPFVVPSALAAILVLEPQRQFANWTRWGTTTALFVAGWMWFLFPNSHGVPRLDSTLLPDLQAAAEEIKIASSADSWIVASMPVVPYEAGVRVPLDLLMGKFAFTAEMPGDRAARLKLTTPPDLLGAIASGEPGAVVLSASDVWSFYWSVPSYGLLTDELRASIMATIASRYRLAVNNEHFRVFLPHDRDPHHSPVSPVVGAL